MDHVFEAWTSIRTNHIILHHVVMTALSNFGTQENFHHRWLPDKIILTGQLKFMLFVHN